MQNVYFHGSWLLNLIATWQLFACNKFAFVLNLGVFHYIYFSVSYWEMVHHLVILMPNVEISVSRWLDKVTGYVMVGTERDCYWLKLEMRSERQNTPRLTTDLSEEEEEGRVCPESSLNMIWGKHKFRCGKPCIKLNRVIRQGTIYH